MAINIYSGSSKSSSSSSKKSKAKKVIKAITRPVREVSSNLNAELKGKAVSNEGTTAVTKSGVLQTVGTLAKKALPIAAKYLPGVAGTVAKLAESVFNDKEWWQHVPGESVTMNAPLNVVRVDTEDQSTLIQPANSGDPVIVDGVPLAHFRPVLLEFAHELYVPVSTPTPHMVYDPRGIFDPTDDMVTQYLMSEIRKVVNAVPLQSASDYANVLANHVAAYAMWQTLKKFDYMLKHGQTYLPSFNDPQYPILQVTNAAYLQSAISRLEEYLHASVRLPHTLCEYLAWRYGRIYKVNGNVKSALVMYNVMAVGSSLNAFTTAIDDIVTYTTSSTAYQFAATDIFNAYYTHDMEVVIRDDTQFVYDIKEFALRTNLDVLVDKAASKDLPQEAFPDLNPVKIDSGMDNPTVFMASTISTVTEFANGYPIAPLIPVAYCFAHVVGDRITSMYCGLSTTTTISQVQVTNALARVTGSKFTIYDMSGFVSMVYPTVKYNQSSVAQENGQAFFSQILKLILAKALEYYNAGYYFRVNFNTHTASWGVTETSNQASWIDATSVADDLGVVSDSVVRNEQIFAFANLIYPFAKSEQTMKQAEAIVAKDTANMISNAGVVAVR